MPVGLFGKLPTKRDFIALNVPRSVLSNYEPWLQAGVATSRQLIGERWTDAFRSAPIWRFWLGASLCGTPVLGALMPSIDAVGRYFPLTLLATSQDGILPPELNAHESWFEAAESVLLKALDPDEAYDTIAADIAALPEPQTTIALPRVGAATRLPSGGLLLTEYGGDLGTALGTARRGDHLRTYASLSSWWTIGGDEYPPAAIAEIGFPPDAMFSAMLTRGFGA
jgi:type VI secretion system protein ImpM